MDRSELSPLTRGTVIGVDGVGDNTGIIPADAGNGNYYDPITVGIGNYPR